MQLVLRIGRLQLPVQHPAGLGGCGWPGSLHQAPVGHPHREGRGLGAGQTQRIALVAAGAEEPAALHIRQREMGRVDLAGPPRRARRRQRHGRVRGGCRRWPQGQPEEGQLEAEPAAIGAPQLSGQVPPLVAECRMRPVVLRKLEATGQRCHRKTGLILRPQHAQPVARQPGTGAGCGRRGARRRGGPAAGEQQHNQDQDQR